MPSARFITLLGEGLLTPPIAGACEHLLAAARLSQRSRAVRGSDGHFVNPWSGWRQATLGEIMRWQHERKALTTRRGWLEPENKQTTIIEADHVEENVRTLLPVVKPDIQRHNRSSENHIVYTWIGHATMLVSINGLNILTDPHFSQRAAPVQIFGPKRYRPPACSISDLPELDIIIISHNHFDHLDYNSVRALAKKVNSQPKNRRCHWYVPLGIKRWLQAWTSATPNDIHDMDWWDKSIRAVNGRNASVVCVPAQHWSQRSLWDKNRTLWGGFVVQYDDRNIYYSGDTGYCEIFSEIGDEFESIDLAILPIGAYEPSALMQSQHINPEEAVCVMQDVRARHAVAVHWGTFALSDEQFLQPSVDLKTALHKKGIDPKYFDIPVHGLTADIVLDTVLHKNPPLEQKLMT